MIFHTNSFPSKCFLTPYFSLFRSISENILNRKEKYETFNHHSFYFIYLWLPWVFIAGCGLSLVAGTTPRCRAQASHCGGFSCCGAWALGPLEFSSVAHGLSYAKACGILPNQERNMSPASAGGFRNTGPLWKSPIVFFVFLFFLIARLMRF